MNKRLITIFLAILLICTLCVTIVACSDKENNDDSNPNGEQTDTPSSPIEPSSSCLVFELKTDDTYEVVGYTGNPISVVIPATYNGKAVTSIRIEAFRGCTSLTSVTIPNSVTSIGSWAFSGCPIEYASIPTLAISSIPQSNLKEVVITGGERIGNYAFQDCKSLSSVTIGNSATSIGYDAFHNCTSLSSVNYLGTIESWCGITFENYYANPLSQGVKLYLNGELLTADLVIPDTVTEIKAYAFYSCDFLTSVTIGNSVESIGNHAFSYCDSLSSVTIGNSVTSIGDDAFDSCTSLSSVNYLGTIEQWCGITFDDYCANPLCNGAELYLNGELVEDLVIPNTVTEIEDWAFVGCTSLSNVTIPDSVTSVGSYAFEYCTSLSSVTIPDSVTSIGDYAFRYCYKLVEVYNLSSLTIKKGSDSNGDVGYYALDVYTSLDTPSKLSTDSNGYIIHTNGEEKTLVGYVGSESELTLPSGITSINQRAFYGCTSLTSVTIPNSVTRTGSYAFHECYNLMSITIGSSVTSIGYDAFYGCYKLVEVYNLSTLTVEKGSGSNGGISRYALDVYTSLDTPSKISTDSDGYIIHTNGEEKTLVGYTGSERELTIPSGITSINKFAFYYCSSLTSVTIGNSVTSIGNAAFYGCDSLISVTIGNSVTSIGWGTFYGCTSLTSVTIPDSVTSIGEDAFYNCISLSSVTIGNSVTSIGDEAFNGCISLSTVYYNGTEEEWSGISISGDYNYDLTDATRYYYSETEPTTSGNYWHYVDGVPTPW